MKIITLKSHIFDVFLGIFSKKRRKRKEKGEENGEKEENEGKTE